jgi:hypothetical protein
VGAISGRVAPATAGRWGVVQRREAGGWVPQFEVPTHAGGRYRAAVRRAGTYRVRYRGESGPPVRVG